LAYQDLSGAYDVSPCNPRFDANMKPIWGKNAVMIVNGKDTSIFNKNAFYPQDFKGAVSVGKMREYNIVDIIINPYLYNPVQKTLRKLTGGVLTASFSTTKSASSGVNGNVKRILWAEKQLRKTLANPQVLDAYGAAPQEAVVTPLKGGSATQAMSAAVAVTGTYVIVTRDEILNNSFQLSGYGGYVYRLRREGADVVLATQSQYGDAATADARARNIRTWLKTNLTSDWHYVLLIGNPNPENGDVPMKKCTGIDEVYGTDFYYAEMTGDWEAGTIDNHADVAVGRIPVYTDPNTGGPNIANLDKILQKTLNYKVSLDKEWRRYALIPIVPLFMNSLSHDDYRLGETIINTILQPAGWQYRRLYDPYYGNYYGSDGIYQFVSGVVTMNPLPEEPYCNETNVVNNWNNNYPGLVIWHSHGNSKQASYILSSGPKGGSVNQLNDQYPAIVFAASCATSYAQEPYNLGSETLLYNAVAYLGGTKSLADKTIDYYAPIFTQAMVEGVTVGDAMNQIYPTTVNDDNYGIALYGCPEVSLDIPVYGLPAPQINGVVPVSNTRIDVSWNTVSGANYYAIERGDESATRMGTFNQIGTVSSQNTSLTDNTCAVGTKYKYRVYAVSNTTQSGYSAIDSSTSFLGGVTRLPSAPQRLYATTDCYVTTLTWPTFGATSYNVKRSSSSSGPFVTVGNATTGLYKDSNLINGNTYYYVVSGVNNFGQSENSNYISIVPQPSPPKAEPVLANPAVRNSAANSFEYWWNNPNADNVMWFEVESYYYQHIGASYYKKMRPAVNWPRTYTMYAFGGLENNQTVYFHIRGCNEYGQSAWSSEASGTTLTGRAINTPTNFRGTATSPNEYLLQWNPDPSNPSDVRYEVYGKNKVYPADYPFYLVFSDAGNVLQTKLMTGENSTDTFSIRAIYTDPVSGELSCSPYSSKLVLQSPSSDPCAGVQGGGSGLKGSSFGLNPPYAAGSEYCKATDGNTSTFYDYSQANGGYTGLDLGSAKVIGKIRYYPRSGFGSRMNGGKFQGSNTSNSSGFADLYTISTAPAVQWNEVTITNSTAYRWVRYLSAPNGYGNVAEVEFYEKTTTQYTITASAGANGSISPTGSVKVNSGASQTFTITPNSGYAVSAVTVDGSNKGAITSYPFTNVTANHTISATFAAAAATVYEAENGTLSGGAAKNTNHTGYSGTGFVDGFYNSTTAQVSFAVNAASAGSYVVKLHYSAGNGASTNTGLYVNGTKIKNITCAKTTNWDTWADESETVTLNAGNNTIAYKAVTASTTCINIDKLTVSK